MESRGKPEEAGLSEHRVRAAHRPSLHGSSGESHYIVHKGPSGKRRKSPPETHPQFLQPFPFDFCSVLPPSPLPHKNQLPLVGGSLGVLTREEE